MLCVADGMVRVSIAMGKAALENLHMVAEHHIYVNECWKVKMVIFDIHFQKKIDTEIVIHVASRLQPPAPHRWAHTADR